MSKQTPRRLPLRGTTRPWPTAAFALPTKIEEIEKGVSPELQLQRERTFTRRWPVPVTSNAQ